MTKKQKLELIWIDKEVRQAIERIGGTPPEKIPSAEHIKEVEKRFKNATPKLELEEREASGLLGDSSKKTGKETK